MKTIMGCIALGILAVALAGCGPKEEGASTPPTPSATVKPAATTASTGQPLGSLKVGGKAVCAVCAVKDGTTEQEEVKATLDYKGKTYGFCNLDEKAEFISNPAKYAGQ